MRACLSRARSGKQVRARYARASARVACLPSAWLDTGYGVRLSRQRVDGHRAGEGA